MARDLDYGSAIWALAPTTDVLVSDLYLTEANCGRDVELEKFPREEERAQETQKSTQAHILEVSMSIILTLRRQKQDLSLSLPSSISYKQLSWSRVPATQGYIEDLASKKERTRRKRKML